MASVSNPIMGFLLLGLMMMSAAPFSQGYTYEQDVFAINSLYTALGSPPLPGWTAFGGDPCGGAWQGVQCVYFNITGIILSGANLGGQLGGSLENFSSIITIDLSNNHIGGSIPESLPRTIQHFFLSDNQLTGSIPISLSNLSLLTAMSLNNNVLTGEIPDCFQQLSLLENLDLSYNNLSGKLPPSMASLSLLSTLHIQNNRLSGTLDVLKDLSLLDLNIENNLFSGPVPPKLLSIPNFKKDGNPLNTSVAPSPSPHGKPPGTVGNSTRPSRSKEHGDQSNKSPTKIVLIVIAAIVSLIILLILTIVVVSRCVPKSEERLPNHEKLPKKEDAGAYYKPTNENKNDNSTQPNKEMPANKIMQVPGLVGAMPSEDAMINNIPSPPVDKVVVKPSPPRTEIKIPSPEFLKSSDEPRSVVSFSIASLQQYTNSFSEDNLIREGRLGKSFRADFPDGKQLMVMKLDNGEAKLPAESFMELVLSISELRHPNIVELVGYCVKYDQQLLVYNQFYLRTLYDVLHGEDDLRRKLSWNARIQIALGMAKALEYLHEGYNPPVIHQNIESANVLLDDELGVHVCDCGLGSIPSPASSVQLADRIRALLAYEAPEISNSSKHTERSDVYSFGVVLLELLTGRTAYDSSRPRPEQSLVRWASCQLYDIDSLLSMVDPAIRGKFELKSVSRFADIINRCIQYHIRDGVLYGYRSEKKPHSSSREPEFRPPMSEVVQDLMRMVAESRHGKDGNGNSCLTDEA